MTSHVNANSPPESGHQYSEKLSSFLRLWFTSPALIETLHVSRMQPRMKSLQLPSCIKKLAIGAKRLVFADDPIETEAARRRRLRDRRRKFEFECVEVAAR
jgi:hypothetical protein